jgi:hypothetical protein
MKDGGRSCLLSTSCGALNHSRINTTKQLLAARNHSRTSCGDLESQSNTCCRPSSHGHPARGGRGPADVEEELGGGCALVLEIERPKLRRRGTRARKGWRCGGDRRRAGPRPLRDRRWIEVLAAAAEERSIV